MDHYADDLAELTTELDLHDAIHVGHSTGGGEVVRYLARHGESRVAKAALISRRAAPHGPDRHQSRLASPRACSTISRPRSPVAGPASTGAWRRDPSTASIGRASKPSEALIENWWRQGMMGGRKRSTTASLPSPRPTSRRTWKGITVPLLVMHGDDDQVVPYADSGTVGCEPLLEKGRPQDVRRLSPWHAHDPGRDDRRRPVGLHQVLTVGHRPHPTIPYPGIPSLVHRSPVSRRPVDKQFRHHRRPEEQACAGPGTPVDVHSGGAPHKRRRRCSRSPGTPSGTTGCRRPSEMRRPCAGSCGPRTGAPSSW